MNVCTYKSTKHEDYADDNEGFYCSESICFWDVAGDAIEDVDKDKEDSDKDCHPPRNTLWRHEEANPRHDDKHAGREVVGDDVVRHLPPESELEPRDGIVA